MTWVEHRRLEAGWLAFDPQKLLPLTMVALYRESSREMEACKDGERWTGGAPNVWVEGGLCGILNN